MRCDAVAGPPGRASELRDRIARAGERIARWDREADAVESGGSRDLPFWPGAADYRRFCRDMAEAAREKKRVLEAELDATNAA